VGLTAGGRPADLGCWTRTCWLSRPASSKGWVIALRVREEHAALQHPLAWAQRLPPRWRLTPPTDWCRTTGTRLAAGHDHPHAFRRCRLGAFGGVPGPAPHVAAALWPKREVWHGKSHGDAHTTGRSRHTSRCPGDDGAKCGATWLSGICRTHLGAVPEGHRCIRSGAGWVGDQGAGLRSLLHTMDVFETKMN
jgi:hypothetical protein